ncbi:DEAD/DEAH box helicase [Oscillatoria sp. FACHB-1407]|uniref:UvrD-helicase domain-containing protein n=1 Tax=Oscillatoria sp. FACHB-1407 TaxID=2692847 RepID=UPI001685759B|nr:ATP-dependent helicase [Oscillatoria sp. FACHB-1407]MBD2463941.1 DEAD/DEAH box helicase [Oscillatoria sp. FACHB-1407]
MTFTESSPAQGNSVGVVTLAEFYSAYTTFRNRPNDEQAEAIAQPPSEPLFIVAGPGTGKTTCLTLRILKLILVDGVLPKTILATTFTKKAAAELRSRILGWGFQLLEALQDDPQISAQAKAQLAKVDINQVLTGTIDSLCEQILRDFRDPGTQPPILADDFVSKTLLLQEGLFNNRRDQNGDLDEFLLNLQGSKWDWNVGKKTDLLQEIWDRRFQDQVDWDDFLTSGASDNEQSALDLIGEAIADYQQELGDRLMVDFALLEQEVLNRLRQGKLTEFSQQIQVVLVDEYQDTNLLQEGIYFELAKACDGAITVVGDDDQSLYRFRGATVELFSNFGDRYKAMFDRQPTTIFLRTNYRSTQTIIQFVNDYATLDPGYQAVRVQNKPTLLHGPSAEVGVPILGMFRQDMDTLANDLASFVHRIFRGTGYTLPDGTRIECNANGGDLGDCALLCSSPAEYNTSGNPRLPLLLREQLLGKTPTIEVFNPRGQDLTEIEVVAQFGGLLLECLDPGGIVEANTSGLNDSITNTFIAWRDAAINLVSSATAPQGLLEFAQCWALRDPRRAGFRWAPSVPVLELIYGLVHYFPFLHDDPEGQIYLEVFTRQVSACQQVGKFSGRVVTDPDEPGLSEASIKELLRYFLAPIASGTVKVNEDLMQAFPRDRLSILSIHQSKGLEFPLTIVDVGSDFKSNHAAHRFKRFPEKGGTPHTMEDLLRPHTALNAPIRGGRDRTFDDLYRQFFVAYSRPQEVLLLVGLTPTLPGGRVPNIATGWNRNGVCVWSSNQTFLMI